MVYAPGPNQLHTEGIEADTFEALAERAIKEMNGVRGLGMVCGPITTGGTNHQVLNLEIFNSCIRGLKKRGVKLFNQIPYEFGLRRLTRVWEAEGNSGYCMPILDVFYARLFQAEIITAGWFIPGWESSVGARWERTWLLENHRPIHDFSREEICEFLCAEHTEDHVAHLMSLIS